MSGVQKTKRLPFLVAVLVAVLLGFGLVSVPAGVREAAAESADIPQAPGDRIGPDAAEVEETIPEGQSLTGRQIYERFYENRFRESFQRLRVVSRDPGGSEQLTQFTVSLQDHRDENENPTDGVVAKMLVEVSDPFDMRHSAYLMIHKDPGPDDEFAYQPSQRRVKRVDLRSTSLFGTDFTFNDIAFQNIEDAEYVRLPDEEIDGIAVYVVEAHVKETIDVEYHRTMTYMEKEHYIPLRTRYWDDFGVEVKEQVAPASAIKRFGETWVATESTMTDLRQQTSSDLLVEDVDTNPRFHRKTFHVSQLTKGK